MDEEAVELRRVQALKEAELSRKYSTFVDSEPSFVFNPTTSSIPKTIEGVDRILIESKINNILYNEKKALEQAALYRDKCTELEQKCRELQTEKEAVRYFWRNKLLEGQSHAAQMLKKSLMPKS